MSNFKDRPLGQLSYIEQCQMIEIKKLKSIVSHLLDVIECYRQEIPEPPEIIGDSLTPSFKPEFFHNQAESEVENENI